VHGTNYACWSWLFPACDGAVQQKGMLPSVTSFINLLIDMALMFVSVNKHAVLRLRSEDLLKATAKRGINILVSVKGKSIPVTGREGS
jgi:hypothetical protein